MGKNITKKTAVIIGATGNVGKALTELLTQAGYTVDPVWNSKNHPDATQAASYKDLPKKIDLAVYLAGLNVIKPTQDLSEEEWDRVMNVNLRGVFLFAKHAFPAMKASGKATFVVISSIMTTHPYPERAVYTASKAALEGLTRELAVEWGKYGISTHCIRLGHLKTLMKTTKTNPALLDAVKEHTPLAGYVQAKDVAGYITWLAEGGSRSLSGTIIDFDPAYVINRWPL